MKKLLMLALTLTSFAAAASAPTTAFDSPVRQAPCLGCY